LLPGGGTDQLHGSRPIRERTILGPQVLKDGLIDTPAPGLVRSEFRYPAQRDEAGQIKVLGVSITVGRAEVLVVDVPLPLQLTDDGRDGGISWFFAGHLRNDFLYESTFQAEKNTKDFLFFTGQWFN